MEFFQALVWFREEWLQGSLQTVVAGVLATWWNSAESFGAIQGLSVAAVFWVTLVNESQGGSAVSGS